MLIKYKGTCERGVNRKERHLEQNEGSREAERAQKAWGIVTNIGSENSISEEENKTRELAGFISSMPKRTKRENKPGLLPVLYQAERVRSIGGQSGLEW